MKVKQLISVLKKLPQNMEVGVSLHDNSDGEVAGWVHNADEYDEVDMSTVWNIEETAYTGKRVVIIHC